MRGRVDGVMVYTGQAPGAIPNGARIVKVYSEPGDANPVGTSGTVLGSLADDKLGLAYFVEWDTYPGLPVAVVARKIAEEHKA